MRALAVCALLAALWGCGAAVEPQSTDCKAKFPVSQQASMPCCPEWGIDACGANLYCAAQDGRTQPTCYPERGKQDMTECSANIQCASGACNTAVGKCKSDKYAACTTAIGCIDGWSCSTSTGSSTLRCQ
jgi:hypothetical protein